MTNEAVTVFLIDANRLLREGLKRLFENTAFSVLGEAAHVAEGAAAVSALHPTPDLVLIDLADGGKGEMEALRTLRADAPRSRLVILDGELSSRRLADALSAGVDGYLLKTIAPDALVQSLRLVMTGETVFPTHLADFLRRGTSPKANLLAPAGRHDLSPRETQILRCLIDGQSNKMIALGLAITEATVKVHLKSLLRKINVNNRTQAAIWAMNNGIEAHAADIRSQQAPEVSGAFL